MFMTGDDILARKRPYLTKLLVSVVEQMTGEKGKRPSLRELLQRCEVRLKGGNDQYFDIFSEKDCKALKILIAEQFDDVQRQYEAALSKPIDLSEGDGGSKPVVAGGSEPTRDPATGGWPTAPSDEKSPA